MDKTICLRSDVKETKIIETNSEDTAISILEGLEQTAHDRKLFREKINRCIPQARCLRKQRQSTTTIRP